MGKALLFIIIGLSFFSGGNTHAQESANGSTSNPGTIVAYPKTEKKKKPKKKATAPPRQKDSRAAGAPVPVTPATGVAKINEGNQALQKLNSINDRCATCDFSQEIQSAGTELREGERIKMRFEAPVANKESTGLVEFSPNAISSNTKNPICGSRNGGYNVCLYRGETIPSKFSFSDSAGPISREWAFEYPGQARQDAGFFINDNNDNANSKTKMTYMMVFPRKYIPSIRFEGNQQIVTLPTGESVTFDAKTKKALSGVLSQNKSYTGSNVVIRADRTGGDDPRFGKGSATISKNGKSCKVPLKALWPDQSESSSLHFKFPTDQEFDEFLKKQKCGFSVF